MKKVGKRNRLEPHEKPIPRDWDEWIIKDNGLGETPQPIAPVIQEEVMFGVISAKTYFENIAKLLDEGSQFPISLDEVWMILYSEKGKAVRALQENFIEGVDFNLAQNGKVINSCEIQNGVRADYFLSVSCLEYFIVRKIRPVFEVYRQVFHRVRKEALIPRNYAEALRLAADQYEQIQLQKKQLEEQAPKVDFAETVTANDNGISVGEYANQIL
jgi:hypothetical protein